VTALLLLRPSFASEQTAVTSGKLIVILDYSMSMKITGRSQEQLALGRGRQVLEWPDVKEALDRLQKERQDRVVIYQGAEDIRKYDPASEADGKRTDIASGCTRC